MRTTGIVLLWVLLIAAHIATLGYFVPMHVAIQRRVQQQGPIIVINVLLGWTLVGWVVALAMAVRDR